MDSDRERWRKGERAGKRGEEDRKEAEVMGSLKQKLLSEEEENGDKGKKGTMRSNERGLVCFFRLKKVCGLTDGSP